MEVRSFGSETCVRYIEDLNMPVLHSPCFLFVCVRVLRGSAGGGRGAGPRAAHAFHAQRLLPRHARAVRGRRRKGAGVGVEGSNKDVLLSLSHLLFQHCIHQFGNPCPV